MAATAARVELMEAQAETGGIAQRKRIGSKPVRAQKSYGRRRISNGHDVLPE